MRIAVVGAGISGLVCAHLLHEGHDLTVFEANDYAGGHTNTVRVDTAHETHHVDTGFIVHNDRNYPYFLRLLESVGRGHAAVRDELLRERRPRRVEYNGASANGLFANRANLVSPSFHRMVRDLLRFNREAPALVGLNGSGPSLGEFLHEGGYSPRFVEQLHRAPGLGRVVGRPGVDVGLPGEPPGRVLRPPRHVRAERPAALAHRGRRLGPLRRAAARGFGQPCGSPRPVRRIERLEHGVEVRPEGGEPELLRRGDPRHPLRSGPGHARRRHARRSARCSGRSPTSGTTWCSTPTSRCCPGAGARGRAGTITSRTSPWAGRP